MITSLQGIRALPALTIVLRYGKMDGTQVDLECGTTIGLEMMLEKAYPDMSTSPKFRQKLQIWRFKKLF